ncbi:hypothetical protein CALCODRAFT_509915 [Calocera cornea HHB12733]|uniref:Uncharacterized protein n=1 Tax=Calocera cornea HHB12733 TaxID=1353952 RepID=A0A165EXV9_9BASI|nr:hypothetical protein CALCODRAFT_509915 [Calocera cornea HHB12733]
MCHTLSLRSISEPDWTLPLVDDQPSSVEDDWHFVERPNKPPPSEAYKKQMEVLRKTLALQSHVPLEPWRSTDLIPREGFRLTVPDEMEPEWVWDFSDWSWEAMQEQNDRFERFRAFWDRNRKWNQQRKKVAQDLASDILADIREDCPLESIRFLFHAEPVQE